MAVIASFEGGYRCRVTMGRFGVVVDEPAEVGGGDEGPPPTELLLGSLASCFALAVAHVARKRGTEVEDLSVEAAGDYEGLGFSRLRLTVRSNHPRAELEGIVARAGDYCYVSNTLARAPQVEVRLGDPVASHRPPAEPG
ncbi:MAG: OsmC family protein [Acidimicrobiales bacterium]